MNPVERQILVLDADTAERASIQQILAREGFDVTVVADGPSALRQIDAKPFALVVAEIRLPGPLDGMTTMRLAKAKRPGLKCLFTSAVVPARLWGDDELDDFIAKPLDRRELLGCVFELLERGDSPEAATPQNLEHSGA
jgi:two-component system, OmpR family, response regulator RegX3